jgi:hypothetical protein
MCDWVYVINRGMISFEGPPDAVDAGLLEREYIGQAEAPPGTNE